jgi:N-acetylneuraminic acid mutarotase
MNTARMYHSLASLNGMIYAIGGQDGNNRVLNTVECYNPKTDNWVFIKPMTRARLAASTGVIDGKLYTAGGYGESIRRPILDTVECFNPKKNKWQFKNKLRFPRGHASIVTVNDKLYLCGGVTKSFVNHNSVISSVPSIDVYNKEQDVWEHCSDMVTARHSAGTASVGSLIYIIGGATTQYNRIFRSVECFDTDTKTWVSGVKDLPYPSKWIQCLSLN